MRVVAWHICMLEKAGIIEWREDSAIARLPARGEREQVKNVSQACFSISVYLCIGLFCVLER